jgi:hypothetical protein
VEKESRSKDLDSSKKLDFPFKCRLGDSEE